MLIREVCVCVWEGEGEGESKNTLKSLHNLILSYLNRKGGATLGFLITDLAPLEAKMWQGWFSVRNTLQESKLLQVVEKNCLSQKFRQIKIA